ncbi:hypothetical protein ABZT47_15320 [Sphaerisporangium sp. NPDC005289]|uniref:hypothetical protein n=1 Tax=Sphaerisporangium sp. NPDC005289 TaxID=3155247 RepID=UPI0033A1275A
MSVRRDYAGDTEFDLGARRRPPSGKRLDISPPVEKDGTIMNITLKVPFIKIQMSENFSNAHHRPGGATATGQ